jgi:hypothetical protein
VDLFTSPNNPEIPEIVCPTCREALPVRAKFCLNCGRAVWTSAEPSAIPADFSSAATSYDDMAGGERRQATVLFSDLSGIPDEPPLLSDPAGNCSR